MTPTPRTQLVLGIALLSLCGCRGREDTPRSTAAVDDVYEKGPLTVHVRVDPNTLSLSGLLHLEFEASLAPGYRLRMPAIDAALQDFGIVDWQHPADRLGPEGRRIQCQRYELEPFLSGTYELPAFTFTFHDVNDPNRVHSLETDPVPVQVTSLLGSERENLQIADIETVVPPPRAPVSPWVWVGSGLGLGLVSLGGLWLWRRRRRVAAAVRIFKPAHEVAYSRLQALVAQDLVGQGRIQAFYEAISHILRHYIEDRFALHAPEQTTEEFLLVLGGSDALAAADQRRLREFLEHCDLVKFARHDPSTAEIQDTFDCVKTFIEQTRSEAHRIDVTDQPATRAEEVPA